ncbi:MAG: Holliday junction resolvase RuvX [Candidatus Cloacimonetes bacterium]|nr:Holliday junction resolvase RuvX [Candidatus Cloacimonadota bacterium]MBT4576205.1 Holliday junction resolvase RuvX [Candidatus Cloacimonadota bacterium]
MAFFRLMGIDYGEVRIGLALSDPLQIISQPLKVIGNNGDTFSEINKIVKSEEVGKIILGLPQNLSGEDTKKTIEVREFAEILKSKVDVPVIFWDERYTSVEANEELKQMGYTIAESRKVVDKVAASIILKSYMEEQV